MIKFKESETIELKKSTSQLDNSLVDICAFANHKGGTIYFGIDESGNIIGQQVSEHTLRAISQKVLQKIKPELQPELRELYIEGKRVIELIVKEGHHKPYSIDGKYYKRVGSISHIMSHEEMIRTIKRQIEFSWDSEICNDATYNDLDEKVIVSFIEHAVKSKRLLVKNERPQEVLKKLGLIKGKKLTNASLILFGKEPVKFIPNSEVKCARYKGANAVEFLDMKLFSENLFSNLENIMNFYTKNIRLGAKINGLERIEKWEYPLSALREATINALIHKNYSSNSGVQIAVYDSEIVVMNVGGLPEELSVKKLKTTHNSILRNKLIANVFYLAGYIEKFGSGTLRIINECKSYGNIKLKFNVDEFSFHLHFMKISNKELDEIKSNVTVDKSSLKVPRKFLESSYSEELMYLLSTIDVFNEKEIVRLIIDNQNITISEIAIKLNITDRAIRKLIFKLKQKGILERIGPDKGGYWKVLIPARQSSQEYKTAPSNSKSIDDKTKDITLDKNKLNLNKLGEK